MSDQHQIERRNALKNCVAMFLELTKSQWNVAEEWGANLQVIVQKSANNSI